mgnify:CR=1 FL=1
MRTYSWHVSVSWCKRLKRYIHCLLYLCSPKGEAYSRRFVCPSEPAFGTYGLLFCMKTVVELIIEARVWGVVGLCKLINKVSSSKIAHHMQCWYVCPVPCPANNFWDFNETWYIDRWQWDEGQCTRTILLPSILTELSPLNHLFFHNVCLS